MKALTKILTVTLCFLGGAIFAQPPGPPPKPLNGYPWLTPGQILAIPTTGAHKPAWDQIVKTANLALTTLKLSDQNNSAEQYLLCKAIVAVRTNNDSLRAQVRVGCMKAIGTESDGRTLALGRNLAAVAIAASLVPLEGSDRTTFDTWIAGVRTKTLDGRTLISTHNNRPNNWGTMCGASRAAVDVYLKDPVDLEKCARTWKGFYGDRISWGTASGQFKYGDGDWQADKSAYVGINKKGATLLILGAMRNVDGVIPDDQRRGSFTWPPPNENYVYESLQGVITGTEILHRAGYKAYQWQDQAVLRAYVWQQSVNGYPPDGDDVWQRYVPNYRYGTTFAVPMPARHGKIMGWTDWTHLTPPARLP